MAQATTNALGTQILWDGANPRTFTAKAEEILSGGTFVYISGATACVNSGTSSFVAGDLIALHTANCSRVNGVVLQNTGSNKWCTIATRGTYLMKAGGAVSGGMLVRMCSGANYDAVETITGVDAGSVVEGHVGRALTTAGSENYVVVSLNI